jgi:hypothetical protein
LKKIRLLVASGTLQISTKVIKLIIAIWSLHELRVKKGGEIHVAKDGAHLRNMKFYV